MAAATPPSLKAAEVIAAPLPAPAPAAPPPLPRSAGRRAASGTRAGADRRRRAAAPANAVADLVGACRDAAAHPCGAKPAASGNRNAGRIFVQAGAFAVPENAQRVRARIASLGNAEIVPGTSHGSALYRVRIGPVASETEARRLLSRVVDHGYPEARVVDQ